MASGSVDFRVNAKKQPSTTLCEIVALLVACRRLVVVSVGPPILVIIVPWLLEVYLWFANSITAGHGFICTLLAGSFTVFMLEGIRRSAPTPEKGKEAMEQSMAILPILSFVVARLLVLFISGWRLLDVLFMFTPHVDGGITMRLASCMMLLSLAVLLRFIGAVSMVRCSSVPLRSHPMTTSLVSFVSKLTSFDAFIDLIVTPGEDHGTLLEPSFSAKQYGGLRRYQRPSNAAYLAHIMLSIVVGTVIAGIVPLGTSDEEGSFLSLFRFASCIFAVVVNLLATSLDGVSHELNPKYYMSPDRSSSSLPPLSEKKTLIVSSLVIALLSLAVTYFADDESFLFEDSIGTLWMTLVYAIISIGMFAYLLFVDQAARRMLCVPTVNLKRQLQTLSEDSSLESQLEVALFSFLHGDESLVRSVSMPTARPGDTYVEAEEIRKSDQYVDHMARILLGMDRHHLFRRSHLELDMLRVYLLESVGGGGKVGEERHVDALQGWVNPHQSMTVISHVREPADVPLVRALCAYAGGLGKALTLCSLPTNDPRRLEIEDSSTSFAMWELPRGARACGEWAVMGAARCLVASINSSKTTAADWRVSPLAVLVPMVLQTCYTLRSGVLSYAKIDKANFSATGHFLVDFLAANKKPLRPLVLACDDAALLIVDTLLLYEGPRRLKISVRDDCRLWLDEITNSG